MIAVVKTATTHQKREWIGCICTKEVSERGRMGERGNTGYIRDDCKGVEEVRCCKPRRDVSDFLLLGWSREWSGGLVAGGLGRV